MTRADKPPIAPNVNLRDFRFMPLDVIQLANSETWGMADGWAAKACINLWCRSWHQVPAGSLPDNDALLRGWAGVPNWDEVRENALRGFHLYSDGRLYHAVICAKARDAWREKQRFRKAAKARWKNKKRLSATHEQRTSDAHASDRAPDDATHIQVKGTGKGTKRWTGTIEKKEPSLRSGSKKNSPNGLDQPGEPLGKNLPLDPLGVTKRKDQKHANCATRLDPGRQPSEHDLEYARKQGFNDAEIDAMWASFVAHFTNGPGRRKTWTNWSGGNGAWGTWVRNQAGFSGRGAGISSGGQARGGRSEPASVVAAVREITGGS